MSERTSLSRRSLLAAAPVIASVPAAVIAAPIAPIDIELLRLGAELEKAHHYVKTVVPPEEDYPDDFVFIDDIVAAKMIDVPAKSIPGLKAKVRALFIALGLPAEQWDTPDRWKYSDIKDGMVLSIMEDILAMETANG